VNDLEFAKKRLLELSGNVERMISMSVEALVDRRAELIDQVIAMDVQINSEEVRIEEECLKILALHQPVAADLRCITTMLKINNDIERMGDLACNIAERAAPMLTATRFPIPPQIKSMAEKTVEMVRKSLDGFVREDIGLANEVIQTDDTVDEFNRSVISELTKYMSNDNTAIEAALHCFSAARHLEQISDHASNIATDLIYMVSGRIVRHQHTPAAGSTA
jgi:phosphate transport system protein